MSVSTGTRRSRARRGDGDLLRGEILAATGRLLAQLGDEDAVSIRAVAAAVGVTPPSIYRHFADKDTLIHEVCAAHFREFDAFMQAAGDGAPDALGALLARAPAYVRFGLDHPEHYRVLFMARSTHGLDEDPDNPGTAAFAHLVGAVQAAIDEGALTAGDAVLYALGLWSALHGVTSLLISLPNFPWPEAEDLARHVARTQLRGLGALV